MKIKPSPPQILVLGFLAVILVGTVLLSLPLSSNGGCSFVDALFTSTSAVCVTGLIVKDTPNDFTLFGHIVIMILIQIGGLGYMTAATIVFLLFGRQIGISQRLTIKEGLNLETLDGVIRFTKGVLLFTFIFELTGAVALTFSFLREFQIHEAAWYGLFHAVSAFNNAGFSLFSDSLIRYRGDIAVNFIITVLLIVGGIGFVVVTDLYAYHKREVNRLSLHTKIVISTTIILIFGGAVSIYLLELSNSRTLSAMPLEERFLSAYFSSVTPRTAGFNTVDYSLLKTETLFLTIMLMFIGASPGGTGGGLKTSTFAIVFANLYSTFRGSGDTVLFKRRIPDGTVAKSFLLLTLTIFFCTIVTHFVITTQGSEYLPAAFEVMSAFGTVGLSVGDGTVRSFSALFTPFGKFAIIITMFVGRLGPLTLAVAISRKAKQHFRYPEGKVLIG